MYINGREINPDTLVDELTALKPTLEKPEVVVKADESVKSSEILKVMDAAQDAEFKKLIVAGEPLSKKEQRTLEDNNAKQKKGA